MLKIVLRDPRTGVETAFEGDEEEGWSLRDAVQTLTNEICAEMGVPAHEVLFNNEPFRICLKEVVENEVTG